MPFNYTRPSDFDIGQLEAFERAAREGSFTRAAAALDLTQPSVSARIAGLEATLGGPLFERGGRRLRLTPLGRRFLPYAERALAVLAEGMREVQHHRSGRLGHILLGGVDAMVIRMVPEPLERFRDEYGEVNVTIRYGNMRDMLQALRDSRLTLALVGAPLLDNSLMILAHFQEPIRGVVVAEHPLVAMQAERGALKLADLLPYTIFRVPMAPRVNAFVDGLVDSAIRYSHSTPEGRTGAVLDVPSWMALRMLYQGEGVAFLPQSFVEYQVQQGRIVYLELDDMAQLSDEPLIITRRGYELDEPHRAFVRMLKAQWRDLLVFESGHFPP